MEPTTQRACSLCGTMAESPAGGMPEGWSMDVDRHGRTAFQCATCVRANIRAIEGKLPEEYWE